MWLACRLCCSVQSSSSGRGRPFLWGSQYPDRHGQPWCRRWLPWFHQIYTWYKTRVTLTATIQSFLLLKPGHLKKIKEDTPAHTLVVFKLTDDLNVFAFFSQHRSDGMDICCFADEGGKHHVDALLHAKLKVLDIFVWNSRQVYSSTREVDAFLAAQGATVLNFAPQIIRTWRYKKIWWS